jgi:phosphoribosylformylglycinamidine synthase
MVGILPDPARAGRLGFAAEGDAIALVGWAGAPTLAASELAKLRGEALPDGLPEIDIDAVRGVLDAVRDAVRAGELSSCHDIAEGGFLVAIAECCLAGGLGAAVDLGDADDVWTALFGERPGGFVVSGPREALASLPHATIVGTVGGSGLEVAIGSLRDRWELDDLATAHGALAPLFP